MGASGGRLLFIAVLALLCLLILYIRSPRRDPPAQPVRIKGVYDVDQGEISGGPVLRTWPPQAHPMVLGTGVGAAVQERYTEMVAALRSTLTPEDAAALVSQSGLHNKILWDLFPPTNACPNQHRLGQLGDGGKWICMVDELLQTPDCVIYSIGSDGEISFEMEMLQFTTCDLHIFDPTLSSIRINAVEARLPSDRAHFHPIGLGSTATDMFGNIVDDGGEMVMQTLDEIMRSLGHTWVDVLKVDIEGGEWETFRTIFAPGAAPAFSQLQLEVHLKDARSAEAKVQDAVALFDGAASHGYRIFHFEPNIYFNNPGSLFAEYAFIRTLPNGDVVTSRTV